MRLPEYDEHEGYTSERIAKSHKDGEFVLIIVVGGQGYGKSSYSLQMLRELFGDWKIALNMTLFNFWDIVDLLKGDWRINLDDVLPVFCWDDAGIHGSKYLWTTEEGQELIKIIQEQFDIARTRTAAIIATTPILGNLAKPLREYKSIRIKITKNGRNQRTANVYDWEDWMRPKSFGRKVAEDHFNRMLPTPVWEEYRIMRDKYAEDVGIHVENLREKMIKQGRYIEPINSWKVGIQQLRDARLKAEGQEIDEDVITAMGDNGGSEPPVIVSDSKASPSEGGRDDGPDVSARVSQVKKPEDERRD